MKAFKEMYENLWIRLLRILQSEKGQGVVEYALIFVLIAIVVVVALSSMGRNASNVYSKTASHLSSP